MANSTSFKKGDKRAGRKAGTKNKLTSTVKGTVLSVFNELQADPKHNLTAFAKKFPRDFYAIAAKLIPQEIKGDVKTKIQLEIVRGKANTAQ